MATNTGKKSQFRWSVNKDVILLNNLASLQLTIAHHWDQVANATANTIGRELTRKSVQDRFKIVMKRFISEDNKKMRRLNCLIYCG